MTPVQLTGRARTHLVEPAGSTCALHEFVAVPFANLRHAAADAGFRLEAVSGFRDFERQLAIWNGKYDGEKPVYDAEGRRLDALSMSAEDRVSAILLWSALPGASRHHWGTDLDLIDAAAVAPGYRVQLSTAEFAAGGPFAPLSHWLERHASRFGFFRPFRGRRSGVQPEPWHFSFAPVAEAARRALTPGVLAEALRDAPLRGKEQVLKQLAELHARYVDTIDWP